MTTFTRLAWLSSSLVLSWCAWDCRPGAAQNTTWTGGGANNNWSTGTNWSSGTAPTSGTVTFTGASGRNVANDLALDAISASIVFDANAGPFALSGSRMFINGITNSSSNNQSISSSILLGSSFVPSVPIVVAPNGTLTINSNIASPGTFPRVVTGFTKTGEGILRLTNATNDIIGRSIIAQGIVQVASLAGTRNSLGNPAVANSVIRVGSTTTSATLEHIGTGNSTSNRQIAIGSGNGNGSAAIRNNGTGTLVFSNATFNVLDGAGSTADSRSLTLGGSNTGNNNIQGIIQNNSSGSTLKTISLIKEDLGKWILSATNTYTGSTAVNAGTLLINGNQSAATGSVTVASGATLGGTGTVGGATTFMLGAIHSPGFSPGIQTFAGDLTYATGSQLTWELTANSDAGRGTSFDGIDANGVVTINSSVASRLLFNGSGSTVLWSDSFWDVDRNWLVYDNLNAPVLTSSIFDSLLISNDSAGNELQSSRGSFAWSLTGNDIFLNYTANITAVPEPSSLLLLGAAGLGGWLVRGRKRHRKPTTI